MNVFLAALAPGWKVVFISPSASMLMIHVPKFVSFMNFLYIFLFCRILLRVFPSSVIRIHICLPEAGMHRPKWYLFINFHGA